MLEASVGRTGIEIRNLYKIFGAYGEHHVEAVRNGMSKAELMQRHQHVLGLKDISLSMDAGSIQVIMGLSGSGKSTLIRHINRLIEPTAGQILVNGIDVMGLSAKDLQEFRRRQTAMVFQKFALLPHRTVLNNTIYGLEVRGVPRATQIEAGMRWIERVGLKGFENHYPSQLSGGMQQRVGLARALTNDAPILLMDEAYSALDPLIRTDMQTVLLDLQKEIRKTIVFITHDLDEALRLGDRIAILRDGEVIQEGTSQDIVLRPADDYIASFVKEVNRGRVLHVEAVMTPLGGAMPRSTATVTAGTTLEAAARILTQANEDEIVVVDGASRPIGRISLRQVAHAMVTPRLTAEPAETVRNPDENRVILVR
jgi:glycine betaine/proline transport system ATP-binding protein